MANPQTTVAQRLSTVDVIGNTGIGDSLAGLNVQALPDGALVWVQSANRFYQLKKGLPSAVIPDVSAFKNVVAGSGSDSVDGYFVALDQYATVTLVAGTHTIIGFDLSSGGFLSVSYITPGGTQGFLHAVITDNVTATVTSSSNTDTSLVLVQYIQTVGT